MISLSFPKTLLPEPSLQRDSFPKCMVQYLQDPSDPETIKHSEVFRNTFLRLQSRDQPQKLQRMRAIKETAITDLATKMFTAFNTPSMCESLKAELSLSGSFGFSWLSQIYQHGDYDFSWYVYHCENPSDQDELARFSEHWFQKVVGDFEQGRPCSFHQMAEWLKSRKVSHVTSLVNNKFGNPYISLPLLKKLAHLGVSSAEYALYHAYNSNCLGEDSAKIQLNLDLNTRIAGLRALAHLKNKMSADALGILYYRNQLDLEDLSLSEEERTKGMQDLIEYEPTPYYVPFYLGNTEEETLCCSLSLDERLTHLTKIALKGNGDAFYILWDIYTSGKLDGRQIPLSKENCVNNRQKLVNSLTSQAQKGDKKSFLLLWEMYTSNRINGETISLDLSEKKRWDKLEELNTEQTERLYTKHYLYWITGPFENLPCRIDLHTKIAHLEDYIFTKKNTNFHLIQSLVRYYGYLLAEDGTISFEHRLAKLEILATTYQSDKAMRALANYYLHDPTSRESNIPNKVKELRLAPFKNRLIYILNLAINGRHLTFIKDSLSIYLTNLQIKEVIELIAVHARALSHIA